MRNYSLIQEVDKIVNSLNQEIYIHMEKDSRYLGDFLEYESNGDTIMILFLGMMIWSNDDDPREYDEEHEEYKSLEEFIRKEMNHIISVISNISV